MFVDRFQDCGIDRCVDISLSWFIGGFFVGSELFAFVGSESVESSQVGVDELFSDGVHFDFGEIFFEEMNFGGFLHSGEDVFEVLFEGMEGFVAGAGGGTFDIPASERFFDHQFDKSGFHI